MAGDVARQSVGAGVERRQLRPQRDAGGAGERGKIKQQLRRLVIGQRQRVGEDEAAFSVGVADFNAEPLAAGENIAGAEGVGRDGILDDGQEDA